ncbi:hypothetical protein Tco_1069317 [Tanacetum coccineum]|uniref:Uncharacterized protein n=1 Tax=Tanacetum coccineum TaxID=301880 RepID=A0ABQ5HK20_9ASTR
MRNRLLPLFMDDLGFSLPMRLPSHFVSKGLSQPWQTLCMIFARCLTTRVTGHDQPSFQIMQMLYCFINNIHVDYTELLWEWLYYSFLHPTSLIPYPTFMKINHYMTENPEISRRLYEHYHRVENDKVVKIIFNYRKNKEGKGMTIPDWMLTEEMKHTALYQMTPSAPRTPNPDTTEGESSAPCKPTVISQEDPGTRLEPRRDKESSKVKKSGDVLIIHDDEEEEKSPRTHIAPISSDKEKLKELIVTDPTPSLLTPSSSTQKPKRYHFKHNKNVIFQISRRYGYMFRHLRQSFIPRRSLPSMVDTRVNEITKKTVQLYVVEGLLLDSKKTQDNTAKMIVEALQQEQESLQAELSTQIHNAASNSIPSQAPMSDAQDLQYQLYLMMKDDEKLRNDDINNDDLQHLQTSEHGTYSVGESSSKQVMDQEQNPSFLGTQEQLDEFDAWMDDFGTNDDEVLNEEVLQELFEEISREIDEAQLQKAINDMLRQRCNLVEEHYMATQDQRRSLHKYPAVSFLEDDIEERTSRYNLWAKQDHIRRQKEQSDKPKEVNLESKIVEVIKTSYELGHEHKFIIQMMVRRANRKIDPITKSGYKHLNKNDTEDLYLLCINCKVKDYKETGLLGSLSVFIRSFIIRERVHDFQPGMESYQ